MKKKNFYCPFIYQNNLIIEAQMKVKEPLYFFTLKNIKGLLYLVAGLCVIGL
jgi:hypothetical protein